MSGLIGRSKTLSYHREFMGIRPATEEDIQSIREVARETWIGAYTDVMNHTDLQRRVLEEGFYSDSYLEEDIDCEKSIFLVYVEDEEVVGFCQTEYRDVSPSGNVRSHKTAEMRKLYVHPDTWRTGKGSELLDKSIEVLPGFIEKVRIHVLNGNDRAKKFYCSRGFEKIDEESITIWGEDYLADVMQRNL